MWTGELGVGSLPWPLAAHCLVHGKKTVVVDGENGLDGVDSGRPATTKGPGPQHEATRGWTWAGRVGTIAKVKTRTRVAMLRAAKWATGLPFLGIEASEG